MRRGLGRGRTLIALGSVLAILAIPLPWLQAGGTILEAAAWTGVGGGGPILALFGAVPAAAQTSRPPVEHFGAPTLNGQPLPFSNAVRVGDILYLSGQIGVAADGRLPEGIEAQTR